MSQTQEKTQEAAFLTRARAGDTAAFAGLVDPYRRELEVHCYRMLGSVHDAEDTVQETLLRAWSSLDRFQARASVRTWLYRIATNACVDETRRRPRRPEPVEPFPDSRYEQIAPAIYDPAARYARREGMELAFLVAIQELPGTQRAILILRDVLGWSAAEVADMLDMSVAAANSALQRARGTIDGLLPGSEPVADELEGDLLKRYVDAWESFDIDGMVALLREDALVRMPPQPSVQGRPDIAKFFREVAAGGDIRTIRLVPSRANGAPAVLLWDRHDPPGFHGVIVLEVLGETISALDIFLSHAMPLGFAAET